MTEPLPAALRIPEISRFVNRANQLRAIKPAIAYWCEYRAVNQIVGRSLHTGDDDCFNFTRNLIERLESTKAERPDDDAINDNNTGRAYVEQFAQETFARAERTLRANKVTRQTADTFDAAATFLELEYEWGTPEPEVLQRIKFAKWNAARILKAIRQGQDPNESNPPLLIPEPERQLLSPDASTTHEHQVVSPMPQSAYAQYSPPDPDDDASHPLLPRPPARSDPSSSGLSIALDAPVSPAAPAPALQASSAPDPSSASLGPQPSLDNPTPMEPSKLPNETVQPLPFEGLLPKPSSSVAEPLAPSFSGLPPALASAPVAPSSPRTSHRDISQAQKHAKWAISALNFEDVPTAIGELTSALRALGAR